VSTLYIRRLVGGKRNKSQKEPDFVLLLHHTGRREGDAVEWRQISPNDSAHKKALPFNRGAPGVI
jgi:hypothetical protein